MSEAPLYANWDIRWTFELFPRECQESTRTHTVQK